MSIERMVLLLLLSIILLVILCGGIFVIREHIKEYKHMKENNIDTLDMHHLKANDWTKTH